VSPAGTVPPDPADKAVRVTEAETGAETADPVVTAVVTVVEKEEATGVQAETAVPTAPSKSISTN
jgi:hypothetical protein